MKQWKQRLFTTFAHSLHGTLFITNVDMILIQTNRQNCFCISDTASLGQMYRGLFRTSKTCKMGLFTKIVYGLCQSLFFNKVAGLRPATLLKKKTLAQAVDYFCKKLYLTCFTGFWMSPWITIQIQQWIH